MNIDLFLTHHGESGLILDRDHENPVSGVILDAQTREMTLEFAKEHETLHLNIPVEEEHIEKLLFSPRIQVASVEDGKIAGFNDIALLYLNDPYGSDFGDIARTGRPQRSMERFEQFMKRCTFAQAVHRADFGDEGSAGSVLSGINPKALQYAPRLLREQALGPRGPQAAPDVSLGISHAPGPRGPGGSPGSTTRPQVIRRQPPRDTDDD